MVLAFVLDVGASDGAARSRAATTSARAGPQVARHSTTMSASALQRWPGGPVTIQAADRSRAFTQLARYSQPSHGCRRDHQDHRARRLARARGGRGAERGARARAAERRRRARAARCACPASAPARCRRDVVLQQVGREAVMDEAVRRGLPAWYEEAMADAGHHRRSATPSSTSPTCPRRARRWPSRSRSASCRRRSSGDYKGLEVGRREPSVDPEAGAGRAGAPARVARLARDRRARGRERRLRGDGLQPARSTARSSRAARRAATWPSSAPAG